MLAGRVYALLLDSQENVFLTLLLNPTYRASKFPLSDDLLLNTSVLHRVLGQMKELSYWMFFFFSLAAWNPDKNKDLTFLVRYTEVPPLTNLGGVAQFNFKEMRSPLNCRKFNGEKKADHAMLTRSSGEDFHHPVAPMRWWRQALKPLFPDACSRISLGRRTRFALAAERFVSTDCEYMLELNCVDTHWKLFCVC